MPRMLLVTGPDDRFWPSVLKETLAPLGELEIVDAKEATKAVMEQDYSAVIVDASFVNEFALLVSRIRAQRPNTRIIVVTSAPTWPRAREAFLSGATDYILKTFHKGQLLSSIRQALSKPLTPWP